MLALKRPWAALAAAVLAFAGAMLLMGRVPNIFFPPSDHPSFIVKLEMPAGTAIETTQKAAAKLERFMRGELMADGDSAPGIEHWATYIGEAGPRFKCPVFSAKRIRRGFASFQSSTTPGTPTLQSLSTPNSQTNPC